MNIRFIFIILTAATASLLEIIDASIVNVAIPHMMGNIGATLDEISWVTTGYMIANSIVLPIGAWLGSRLGRKNYFTGAILLFTLASCACGLAPNLHLLILFRILQGLAGGALLPTSQTLIQEQFPPEKAGMAMAIFGLSVMVGPALGPTLGGYLTDQFGWRSIFNINVPVGLLAASLSWLYVNNIQYASQTEIQNKKHQNIDWLGLILLCVGIGSFQYVLERGQTEDWMDSVAIRTCLITAMIGIASFIYWELKIPNPIMNLRLFKSSVLRSGTMLMLALGVMVYSLTFAVPVFVARVMPQMTATQTGKLFMPGSIITALLMLPIGKALSWANPKFLVLIGFTLGICSLLCMTHFTTLTGPHEILIPLLIRGAALAFLFIPINQMVLGSFRGEELAQVAGMQNFFRQMGGSIGIASLNTFIVHFSAQNYNNLLSKVNALNPAALNEFIKTTSMPNTKLSSEIGFWDPSTLAVKNLSFRVSQQVFVMSFTQLCWVIVVLVAFSIVPLYLIKPSRRTDSSIMNTH